jgi:starch synthase
MHGLEYHGNMSFIKGGLNFADALTTVSPTYAREIQTSAFGFGLDGLLRHRADVLNGILNGIDTKSWDPAKDPLLEHHYDSTSLEGKQINKALLQKQLGFEVNAKTPLLGFIGRLVWQKGADILAETLPSLLKLPLQFVILGNGAPSQEAALQELAREYPDKLAVIIGYSEKLAHLIEAGCDMFTMLSRYEPCGLNQLYSLRYGTVPIVSNTGGLADTVIDASDSKNATGFTFEPASARHFISAVQRALSSYKDKERWQELVQRGMKQDFSWAARANQYLALYKKVLR